MNAKQIATLTDKGFAPYIKASPVYARQAPDGGTIDTLEGTMTYKAGDYICFGVEGETWAIKKSIFEKTYKKISPEEAKSEE